ncbi:MAG: glycosyltransferase [Anaerolineae bacterium]|nr:glycosyltransferase [Anaerolineae bacterium]NUQ04659.1 glycosyltransferase [Anaerolineae bacterium]
MLRVITVAALDWRSGLEYGLEAVHRLTQRGTPAHYTIIGAGSFLEAVVVARREFALDGQVEILLNADEARVAEQVQQAEVFLLPCVAPGASHGLAAAVAIGKPVVAFDQAEVVAALRGYAAARVVPRRDTAALADALSAVGELAQRHISGGEGGD